MYTTYKKCKRCVFTMIKINIFITLVLFVVLWLIFYKKSPKKTNPPYELFFENNQSTNRHLTKDPNDLDYQKIINLSGFEFIILNLVCNRTSPLLLTLIHSAPKNLFLRNIIRETWGKPTENVRFLFAVAGVRNAKLQAAIEVENDKYKDLIQGNFIDAYRNNTYKHVMLLKYVVYHCPAAKYILKTDDDVFVNTPALMDHLKLKLSVWGARKLMMCAQINDKEDPVDRINSLNKWKTTYEEYSGSYYPVYCCGWAIIYSPDVVFDLYTEAQGSTYFWIDDIHLTGTLASQVNINYYVLPSELKVTKDMVYQMHKGIYSNLPHVILFGPPNINPWDVMMLWHYAQGNVY